MVGADLTLQRLDYCGTCQLLALGNGMNEERYQLAAIDKESETMHGVFIHGELQ
jgi:hypothetical protein